MHPQADLTRFADLFAQGVPYREIARLMGVHPQTLFNWRKELGLPKRKPGAPKRKSGYPETPKCPRCGLGDKCSGGACSSCAENCEER